MCSVVSLCKFQRFQKCFISHNIQGSKHIKSSLKSKVNSEWSFLFPYTVPHQRASITDMDRLTAFAMMRTSSMSCCSGVAVATV